MGADRADDRRPLDGILWMLRSGVKGVRPAQRVRLGHHNVASASCVGSNLAGVWEAIWRATLASLDAAGQLEWAQAFLDGSFVPAKKGD